VQREPVGVAQVLDESGRGRWLNQTKIVAAIRGGQGAIVSRNSLHTGETAVLCVRQPADQRTFAVDADGYARGAAQGTPGVQGHVVGPPARVIGDQ
jgi:hypothetical protein